jgi:hypothetical protein
MIVNSSGPNLPETVHYHEVTQPLRVSHREIDVRPDLDVWHTTHVTSSRIIIGRRVGS